MGEMFDWAEKAVGKKFDAVYSIDKKNKVVVFPFSEEIEKLLINIRSTDQAQMDMMKMFKGFASERRICFDRLAEISYGALPEEIKGKISIEEGNTTYNWLEKRIEYKMK